MSRPNRQLTRVVWIVSILLIVVGCGSTASEKQSASSLTTAAVSTSSTDTSAPASNNTYQTKIFSPGFSVDLPAGWIVAERDASAAQIYLPCDACAHEGEENGEITLDATFGALPPKDAIVRLRGASNLDAEPASPTQLGSIDGLMFTGTRTGKREVAFAVIGYHTEADGEPIDVLAMGVGGRTVTIFVDPHTANGGDAKKFAVVAATIVKSIEFAS
ncbi:MAG: hypothetical protein ABJD24_14760 [Acidimicrobiales bacterium]